MTNKGYSKKIALQCSDKPIYHIANLLNEILQDVSEMHFFEWWYKSLTEESDSSYNSVPEETFINILKDILNEKADHDKLETKKIIIKLLGEEYHHIIFKRLCFYLIYQQWPLYKFVLERNP
jgi:hypothetical protein